MSKSSNAFHHTCSRLFTHCRDAGTPSEFSDELCACARFSMEDLEKGSIFHFDAHSKGFRDSHEPAGPSICEGADTFPLRDLKKLIEHDGMFHLDPATRKLKPFRWEERRELAVRLALNLAVVCATGHTSPSWDKEHIYYANLPRGDYDRTSPYVTCEIGKDPTPHFEAIVGPGALKVFADFAKLLLEIEYGILIHDDASYKQVFKTYLDRAEHSVGDPSKRYYLAAVKACLEFHKMFRQRQDLVRRSNYRESPQETRLQIICTNIVTNLMPASDQYKETPKRPVNRHHSSAFTSPSSIDMRYEVPEGPRDLSAYRGSARGNPQTLLSAKIDQKLPRSAANAYSRSDLNPHCYTGHHESHNHSEL